MRHLLALPLSFLFVLALPACEPLSKIEKGVCGNDVIDEGEECDGNADTKYPCIAKDQPSACTFACNDAGKCPKGHGCGTDNVCRVATGGFRAAPFAEVASEAKVLRSGDFDHDGKADVVAVEPGQLKVLFLNESGDVQQAAFSSPTAPAIGKLGPLDEADPDSGDGTAMDLVDDMVLPLAVGIGGVLSRGDRSFAARTYGTVTFGGFHLPENKEAVVSDVQPFAIDALPGIGETRSGDETLMLVTFREKGAAEDYPDGLVTTLDTDSSEHLLTLPGGTVAALSGPPVKGNFDQDLCQEVAFPRQGAATLVVDKLCLSRNINGSAVYNWDEGRTEAEAAIATIALQGGATIQGPAFVFDVNGDERLDLLITTSGKGGLFDLQVAYGLGTGSFSSVAPGLGENDPFPPADDLASTYVTDMKRVPLALGDLNRDGFPDVVNATQVLMGAADYGGGIHFDATFESKRTWTEAVIGDLNGNLYPDVAACTRNAQNVDVLSGNPSSFLNPALIATEGDVAQLTIGDFDGDLVNDLAFQLATEQKDEDSQLVVAYGRTTGGLEAPVEIGRFRTIDRTVIGNEHAFGPDNITDLGIVSRHHQSEPPIFSVFPGTATRFMQSPLLLSNPMGHGVEAPLQAALGIVSNEAPAPAGQQGPMRRPHNDLVVLAQHKVDVASDASLETLKAISKSLSLWGLKGNGDGDFTTLESVTCPVPDGAFSVPGLEQALSVAVSESSPGSPGHVFLSAPYLTLTNTVPFIEVTTMFSRAEVQVPGVCDGGDPYLGAPGEQFLRMATTDLDHNGKPEILALKKTFKNVDLLARLGGIDGMGDPFAGADLSQVVVFWNGTLGDETSHALVYDLLPEQAGSANDFAIADIDADGRPEIFVADALGIHVYAYDKSTGAIVVRAAWGFDMAGAEAIHVADVDGDGVKDLITGGNSLRFHHGFTTRDEDADVVVGSDPVVTLDNERD